MAYFAFKKYKKCIATMKQALKYKPFMTYEADIFYHLGLAYCRLQKFEKSIYPYSRCIEKIPSDLRYIHERAKAYQMIEEHEKAVADFDVVIRKNPKNAHAYFRMAFSQKALKVSSIFNHLIQILLKIYQTAVENFEKARTLDPMNPALVVNYKKLKGITCIVLCEPGAEKIFQ